MVERDLDVRAHGSTIMPPHGQLGTGAPGWRRAWNSRAAFSRSAVGPYRSTPCRQDASAM
ncbi:MULTISPECIES: hypothetical protein [unclassified Streptomyces]|uniref:hypothetical protein n=1 Tax=unclassified Streptomyces TaxID=2593676 RepID=UPI00380E4CEC